MNLIQKGENQLLEAHTLNGGQLRIGASDTICRYYLVPYLKQFHKEYPNIHIKVINHTSIECAKALENGQTDFIIANYPNSALAGNLHTRVINEFHDVFVASRQAFDLEGKELTLEELLKYPIMMLDRKSTTSEFLHQIFQKSHLDLVPEIELSSNDLLIDLARIGLRISVSRLMIRICLSWNFQKNFLPVRWWLLSMKAFLYPRLPSSLWICCKMATFHRSSLTTR